MKLCIQKKDKGGVICANESGAHGGEYDRYF